MIVCKSVEERTAEVQEELKDANQERWNHPLGEAQQDIPSPTFRRCSKGKHVYDLAWEASNDRKLQLFTMKRKTLKSFLNESLRVWGARKCGIWSENILSRCTTSSQSWRWESEQSSLPFLKNSVLHDLICYRDLAFNIAAQYVIPIRVLCDQVSATKEKHICTSPLLMAYRFFNNNTLQALPLLLATRPNSCSGKRTLNAIFKRTNGLWRWVFVVVPNSSSWCRQKKRTWQQRQPSARSIKSWRVGIQAQFGCCGDHLWELQARCRARIIRRVILHAEFSRIPTLPRFSGEEPFASNGSWSRSEIWRWRSQMCRWQLFLFQNPHTNAVCHFLNSETPPKHAIRR